MIERYSTREMQKIWSEEEKIKRWLLIEKTVNDVLQEEEIIPENNLSGQLLSIINDSWYDLILHNAKELEKETGHDVVAFIFAVENLVGKDGRWIHYGMTSSDLLDTANAMTIKESAKVIISSLRDLKKSLDSVISRCADSCIMARTHGQYAEKILLSNIFSNFWMSLSDHIESLGNDIDITGKMSGAAGDYKYINRETEIKILSKLGINGECFATQVVPREQYAELISRLALIGCTLEKIALQIRLYQQSGIEEMFEPFGRKQTGSSAMPHKRNPILCENVCGLARVLRGYVSPAMEDVALWQQRDISHSSVERIILPDAFNLLHFMIKRVYNILDGLEISVDNVQKHVEENSENDSQKMLLELVRQGKSRQEAYRIVQGKEKEK
jgi:adenylosuccinate lyase